MVKKYSIEYAFEDFKDQFEKHISNLDDVHQRLKLIEEYVWHHIKDPRHIHVINDICWGRITSLDQIKTQG